MHLLDKLGDMKIIYKFFICFGLLLAIVVASSVSVLKQKSTLQEGVQKNNEASEILSHLQEYKEKIEASHSLILGFINSGDITYIVKYEKSLADVKTTYEHFHEQLKDKESNTQDLLAFENIHALYTQWVSEIVEKQLRYMKTPSTVDLARFWESSERNHEIWLDIKNNIETLINSLRDLQSSRSQAQMTELENMEKVLTLSSSVLAVSCVFMAFLLTLIVVKPVKKLTESTNRMKDGDWDSEITVKERGDEIGQMAAALKTFRENALKVKKLEEEEKKRIENELEEKKLEEQRDKKITQDIAQVVSACAKGDFTQRLNLDDKEGVYYDLCDGINQIGVAAENGLASIEKVLEHLSQGDLTHLMLGEHQGVFKDIQTTLNSTITQLSSMVNQIIESVATVSLAAAEIASGSADLAHRTERQASTIEETSATMDILTNTVKETSKNAMSAKTFSQQSSSVATEGGNVVHNAVVAMQEIQAASKQISDIIGTIDEIAFQTNLLALNAAVEAARAGEAGKGFAVVASEVRELAGRSAESSKEIKELITNSVNQIDNGVKLVNDSGTSLEGIIESVNKVLELIGTISNSSQEQSDSIGEVNSAVSEMDSDIQQNAALVEENTAAAQSMSNQAAQLKQLISFFKTADNNLSATSTGTQPTQQTKPAASVANNTKNVVKSSSSTVTAQKETNPSPLVQGKKNNNDDGWEEF